DSVFINVNKVPQINLKPIGDICCDHGDISLNFYLTTPSGGSSNGSWSCTEYPSLVQNNVFYTDTACTLIQSPSKNVLTYVQYNYTDPTSLCVNSDSVLIQVNKLPRVILQDKDYCQDFGGVRLDDEVVISPANTSLGTPSWKCLDSNWTGNHFYANMLENRGSSFAPDYWLNIDTSNYTMQNPDIDTISLEYSYVSEKGCRSSEEADVRVWRVPKLQFSKNRELCFDEGEVDLDSLTGVNISGGRWYCYDSTSYDACSGFSSINGSIINTMNTIDDDQSHSWIIRYYDDLTGCPAQKLIPITVNPLPAIVIDQLYPSQFCETDTEITMRANPIGGVWSCSDSSAVAQDTFYPYLATEHKYRSWIYYDYTAPNTGCDSRDSIRVKVDARPRIDPIPDTTFCKEEGVNMLELNYNLKGQNFSGLNWVAPAGLFTSNLRASLSPYSDVHDEVLTLQLQNAKADTFRIVIFAFPEPSSTCRSVDDYFDVIVHPTPEGQIVATKPSGCKPVSTEFYLEMDNQIDPDSSSLNWDLWNGNTSTRSRPSATFVESGRKAVSVSIESKAGCSSVFENSVDVYSIPVAEFVPNPNNNAPVSNPRFVFNNKSFVNSFGGSAIVSNFWKFDEGGSSTNDTSSATSPGYFYPAEVASYQVLLKVETNHGCVDSFSYPVHVGKPGSVSVEDVIHTDVKLFPNPSNGTFIVSENVESIMVYDLTGREILTKELTTNRFSIQSKGIYLVHLKLQNEEQVMVKKVFVK
ncbi:MAG: T9SS type A sorting domain-containing protein, partial [Bacteroidia bacterium]